jgi:hypothetical protein
MRCNASPTTSTAADPVQRHEVAARFEALLFAAALAPLAKPLGFFGDAALAATSLALARRSPLTATFERLINAHE